MSVDAYVKLADDFAALAARAEKWWNENGKPPAEEQALGQTRAEAEAAKVTAAVARATGTVPGDAGTETAKRYETWRAYWKKRGAFGSEWLVWGAVCLAAAFVLWPRRR